MNMLTQIGNNAIECENMIVLQLRPHFDLVLEPLQRPVSIQCKKVTGSRTFFVAALDDFVFLIDLRAT